MLPSCLQSVKLSLIPHLQKEPNTRHEGDLLRLADATLDPCESAVALLSYLTVQVRIL